MLNEGKKDEGYTTVSALAEIDKRLMLLTPLYANLCWDGDSNSACGRP